MCAVKVTSTWVTILLLNRKFSPHQGANPARLMLAPRPAPAASSEGEGVPHGCPAPRRLSRSDSGRGPAGMGEEAGEAPKDRRTRSFPGPGGGRGGRVGPEGLLPPGPLARSGQDRQKPRASAEDVARGPPRTPANLLPHPGAPLSPGRRTHDALGHDGRSCLRARAPGHRRRLWPHRPHSPGPGLSPGLPPSPPPPLQLRRPAPPAADVRCVAQHGPPGAQP